MARLLPDNIKADFLTEYNVGNFAECAAHSLTIKVWDLFGTAPSKDEDINARGQYVAAIIICDSCDKSLELHRKDLTD